MLYSSLIYLSQGKTTVFRPVKVIGPDRPTGQPLLEPLTSTSLKIMAFVYDKKVTLR